MNNIKLGSFVIKLLGVFAIIQSLPAIQYLVFPIQAVLMGSDDVPGGFLYFATSSVPFLFSLMLAIILITCSESIARIILRHEDQIPLDHDMSVQDFQAICFSAVGVFVILNSLPKLCMLIMNSWQMRKLYQQGIFDSNQHYSTRAWESGVSFLVQFVGALVLFFGSRGLANLWHRIQVAKYVKINNNEAEHEDSNRPADAVD